MNDPRPLSLEILDPGQGEPGYWSRFHRRVMGRAESELARRRAQARLTVSQVVHSWARAVVPAALAAAAAALLLIATQTTSGSGEMELAGVEELLLLDLDDEPIPVVLSEEAGSTMPGDLAMERF